MYLCTNARIREKLSPRDASENRKSVCTERGVMTSPTICYIAYACIYMYMMIMTGCSLSLSIRRSFDKPRQMSTDRRLLSRSLQNVCQSPRKSRTDANTNANSTTVRVCIIFSWTIAKRGRIYAFMALKLAVKRDK